MAAVANNPKFAKQVGIPQSVGKDYVEADKGRKFRSGGMAGCGTKKMAVGGMAMSAGKGYKAGGMTGPDKEGPKKRKKGKSNDPAAFPDLNNDGKVTQADVLKGRGAKGYKAGGCVGDGCAIRGHTKGRMV
jgi:hypothetical protein